MVGEELAEAGDEVEGEGYPEEGVGFAGGGQ
jgi:hypothetical protein